MKYGGLLIQAPSPIHIYKCVCLFKQQEGLLCRRDHLEAVHGNLVVYITESPRAAYSLVISMVAIKALSGLQAEEALHCFSFCSSKFQPRNRCLRYCMPWDINFSQRQIDKALVSKCVNALIVRSLHHDEGQLLILSLMQSLCALFPCYSSEIDPNFFISI